jgi:hypothetical protein
MHGVRIFKDSGNTPELVQRAQLYTKSHANRSNKSEFDFYNAVLTLTVSRHKRDPSLQRFWQHS